MSTRNRCTHTDTAAITDIHCKDTHLCPLYPNPVTKHRLIFIPINADEWTVTWDMHATNKSMWQEGIISFTIHLSLPTPSWNYSLPFNKFAKDAIFDGDQVSIGTHLRNIAMVKDSDVVGCFDGGEAVSDGEHSAVEHKLLQGILHQVLTLCIQRAAQQPQVNTIINTPWVASGGCVGVMEQW